MKPPYAKNGKAKRPKGRLPSLRYVVPIGEKCDAEYHSDAINSAMFCASLAGGGRIFSEVTHSQVAGTYVHRARQTLAEDALRDGVDLIFWTDADMRFPADAPIKLLLRLAENPDVSIVGANYSTRKGTERGYTAIKRVTQGERPAAYCMTVEESTGLEEVEAIGFGCVLMRREVLAALHDPNGPDGPWFWYDWIDYGETYNQMGEDVFFCGLARKAGFKIHVDHDLSKEIIHIGKFGNRYFHAEAFAKNVERDGEPVTDLVEV